MTRAPIRSKYSLAGITVFGGIFLAVVATGSSSSRDFDELRAGPVTYLIPREYRAGGDTDHNVFMQVKLADWKPLERDKPGWEDNINILIGPQPQALAGQYAAMWDGTPEWRRTKWDTIERTYRVEPEFTVQEMGSTFDIIVPDQDRETMPIGLMQCTRPDPPLFPNAGCALLFDRDGQRWKISFGRQFLRRYSEFRERATTLFDSFREARRQ